MLAVPVPVGTTLYQIVFGCPDPLGTQAKAEAGGGSFVCVVAPELSFVSANVVDVMLIALAKLSLIGAGAVTTNVGNATGLFPEFAVPPPGGRFDTPTEFVLPKLAMKLAGTVAVSCVELTKVVGMGVPPTSGSMRTVAFDAKPVPVTIICVAGEFTGLLGRFVDVIVGGVVEPITVNVSGLLVPVPVFTVTCGKPTPAVSEASIVAIKEVSLPPPCVTPVMAPFHCTDPPARPFPLTVNETEPLPAFAVTGEIEEMCGPGNVKLFSTMSHPPRPCVAARSVRDARCNFRECTATRGSPVLSVDHVQVA